MKVVNPAGRVPASDRALAPRPSNLQGMVIAVLDNRKENADVVLHGVVEALSRRENPPTFVHFLKNFPAEPAHNLDEVVAHCDAVINGVGH